MTNNSEKERVEGSEWIGDDTEPYCRNCGEDKNLAYDDQYANGERWTCKECGEVFFFIRIKNE